MFCKGHFRNDPEMMKTVFTSPSLWGTFVSMTIEGGGLYYSSGQISHDPGRTASIIQASQGFVTSQDDACRWYSAPNNQVDSELFTPPTTLFPSKVCSVKKSSWGKYKNCRLEKSYAHSSSLLITSSLIWSKLHNLDESQLPGL